MPDVSVERIGTRVVLDGLTRTYPDGTGLLPTDLSIEPGEFLSVLGPSGCGKSTLLRLLAGLDRPQHGRIRFDARVVCDAGTGVFAAPRTRKLGMVFQDLALWPHLSVAANVGFPLRVTGVGRAQAASRVDEALARVELRASAQKMPHQLSGGQQQRVAIARALVARPALLLMDEPLSALDAALREQLRIEIRSLTRESGVTTVFVTHDQAEAMSMSDRVVVMRAGSILQHGSPEDLYHRPADRFVAEFVGTFNALPTGGGVRAEQVRILDRAEDCPGVLSVSGRVRSVVFTGGVYQLRCDVDGVDRPWVVPDRHPRPVGALLRLAVFEADVLTPAS